MGARARTRVAHAPTGSAQVRTAPGRAGTALLEVAVALICSLVVVQLALGALSSARRVEADLRARSDRTGSARVARTTLRRELRAGVEDRDWVVHAPDSVRVRSFRGRGLVCPDSADATELVVTFEGTRRPDPAKDSVLLLDVRGSWSAVDLVAVRSEAARCPAAPTLSAEAWEIAPPASAPIALVRLFETGSYHLVDRALRYRVGSGGRQPLTPEVLDTRTGGFVREGTSAGVRLEVSGARPWRWSGRIGGRP